MSVSTDVENINREASRKWSYKAINFASKPHFRNTRFSCLAHAIFSCKTWICIGAEFGMAENSCSNVRTAKNGYYWMDSMMSQLTQFGSLCFGGGWHECSWHCNDLCDPPGIPDVCLSNGHHITTERLTFDLWTVLPTWPVLFPDYEEHPCLRCSVRSKFGDRLPLLEMDLSWIWSRPLWVDIQSTSPLMWTWLGVGLSKVRERRVTEGNHLDRQQIRYCNQFWEIERWQDWALITLQPTWTDGVLNHIRLSRELC